MRRGSDESSVTRGHITYAPVVPGRVEFAAEVRRRILELRPKVVGIELPGKLRKQFIRAVERLPEMSVIVYPDPADDDRAIYIPVEPADAFTEAVRSALEIEAEVLFIEPDHVERPHISDSYPDTYTVLRLGMDRYVATYRAQ